MSSTQAYLSPPVPTLSKSKPSDKPPSNWAFPSKQPAASPTKKPPQSKPTPTLDFLTNEKRGLVRTKVASGWAKRNKKEKKKQSAPSREPTKWSSLPYKQGKLPCKDHPTTYLPFGSHDKGMFKLGNSSSIFISQLQTVGTFFTRLFPQTSGNPKSPLASLGKPFIQRMTVYVKKGEQLSIQILPLLKHFP